MDSDHSHSRRSFLRGGMAAVLSAWFAACQAPARTAAPVSSSTAAPAATSTSGVALPLVESNTSLATSTAVPAPRFSGAQALTHAQAQMQWVPRDTGSQGWRLCGDYIRDQFAGFGWKVEEQHFSYQTIDCRNIIAKRGTGPGIIIGAHYDARRRADRDSDPAKVNDPVPAANDGASGVAVLLELARVLKPEELGFEIWLAAFDAEDNGDLDGWDWIVGSTYMADNLTITPEAVVVVDMIGDKDQQLYYEGTSDEAIRTAIWNIGADLGYTSFVPEVRHSMLDDHTPFLRRGLPAIDIIDFDYPYWHTTEDTLDKISPASLAAVGCTLETWLLGGAKRD